MSVREADDAGPATRCAVAVRDCRLCGAPLSRLVVDLGSTPLCQQHVTAEALDQPELFYPLRVLLCGECWLMQLACSVPRETIFCDHGYAYLASYSGDTRRNAEQFARAVIQQLGLSDRSFVVEAASNDGYLLQHFRRAGVPCVGFEPAANVAEIANRNGLSTRVAFFGHSAAEALTRERRAADLIVANNVLPHVPDPHDFIAGVRALLAPEGVFTAEFQNLRTLLSDCQFDTIYHEHYSYFCLATAGALLERHGLRIFDVEELATHGGSLRLYACHAGASRRDSERIRSTANAERTAGLRGWSAYAGFGDAVQQRKRELLSLLIAEKSAGRTVVGYGAPGKSATLLNYCGIRSDLLAYTVDKNPLKQGCYTPGTRIPIHAPSKIFETQSDLVLVLPWNLRDEIRAELEPIRAWGGKLAFPIPELVIE